MIVVDSSVWIDFFRGRETSGTQTFKALLNAVDKPIIVPDLVLFEVLRGFRQQKEYARAFKILSGYSLQNAFDISTAVEAAQHYRAMVGVGYTIRSALDVMIGAFCIQKNYVLLHSDRDFQIMHDLRGLKTLEHLA